MARTHRAFVILISALLIYGVSFSLVHKLTHLTWAAQFSEQNEHLHGHSGGFSSAHPEFSLTNKELKHSPYCTLCSILALYAITPAQFSLATLTFIAFPGFSEGLTHPVRVSRNLTQARAPPTIFFRPLTLTN